jgi:quinoprotein dehydrogenase-associated probable ABC transporter substrate-binding protein
MPVMKLNARFAWPKVVSVLAVSVTILGAAPAGAVDINMADAVNHKILRVCSKRANLPYSNEKGEGFENKIAEIVAGELGIPVKYTWSDWGLGLVDQTLNRKQCDLVMATAQTELGTLNTNHYYRSTYALVYRAGQGLDGVNSIADARLTGKRVGVQTAVPATQHLVQAGLMVRAKLYPLWTDTRADSPAREMIADIRNGSIDAGVLWGPHAGYFAARDGEPLIVSPILDDVTGTGKLEYRVTMGVRLGDSGWKRKLNTIIAKRRADITAILQDYGVPLVGEDNTLIAAPVP